MPGTLPTLNKQVLDSAIKLGLATHCGIARYSIMARKNYFYPDLPKGYQISQFEDPICQEGYIDFFVDDTPKKVRLIRIHIEEDAGKSIHDIGEETYMDANRCGVPLLEIVSYPDIRGPKEASQYLQKLRQTIKYLGISDGNMEEGSLRCDANISLREFGTKEYGTRTEVKNMNSFKSVEKAIEFEAYRQQDILKSGGKVVQETRLWDADKLETRSMRSKEFAHDYRYFPEPDLVPITVSEEDKEAIGSQLPEFPEVRKARFISEYDIPEYDAGVLTVEREIADYFEETVKLSSDAKASSNWVMGEVMRTLKEQIIDIDNFNIHPNRLASLLNLIKKGTISNSMAKSVFEKMLDSKSTPEEIVQQEGLAQVSDTSEIEKVIDSILAESTAQVEKYKSGKTNVFGFFVGQTMKQMKGKANPKVVNEILKAKLDA
jgi:aspartyl-tRNA(Asn)/glutamyl-tRNA(Gln) amidotransferase subunit B